MIEQVNINKTPKVSIGMPVYNGEKYIREALDSLLAQTFTDFELIISDNCSTDNTQNICNEYVAKDSRVKYVKQIQNIGIAPNFDFVLRAAKAEYFMWAASDDFWDTNWIGALYSKASGVNGLAVFGKVAPVDKFSKKIEHIAVERQFNFIGKRIFRKLLFYVYPEVMGKANVIHGLYRSEILKQINISSYIYDYIFIFDLLNSLEVKSVSDTYFYKRIYAESSGNQLKNSGFFKKMLKILIPLPIDLFKQYLSHASYREKLLILMFTPIKFLLIYIVFFNKLIKKLFK